MRIITVRVAPRCRQPSFESRCWEFVAAPARLWRACARTRTAGSQSKRRMQPFARTPTDPMQNSTVSHAQTQLFTTAESCLLAPYDLGAGKLEQVFGSIMAHRIDYADLYFQYVRSEGWSLEEGIVKSGSFNIEQGVGVRAVSGEKTAFAFSDDISLVALEARSDCLMATDLRPLVRLSLTVIVEENGRREQGSAGGGGRFDYAYFDDERLRQYAGMAVDQALVNLRARPAPAGNMTVVLGPGWPGILLHEAIGHGLEGDFNRKGSSAFSGRVGERVAAGGVTVVDDGTIPDRRGSLNIDDEGNPSQ